MSLKKEKKLKKTINQKEKKHIKKNIAKRQRKHRLKTPVRNLLLVVLLSVFLYATGRLVFNELDLRKSKQDHHNLVEEVTNEIKVIDEETGEVTEKEDVDFDKLLAKNKDIVGWIRFNQNKINYPIAQGPDNNFYLRRNLDLKYSTAGTIFLDYRNTSFNDQNAILFGHAMSDKTMFGTLEDVFHAPFWENPEDIEISTKEYIYTYKIFSYYTIQKEEYYITPTFKTDALYEEFIDTIKKRSWQNLNVSVTPKDSILTLSTCVGVGGTSKRRVIHAVRISTTKKEIVNE